MCLVSECHPISLKASMQTISPSSAGRKHFTFCSVRWQWAGEESSLGRAAAHSAGFERILLLTPSYVLYLTHFLMKICLFSIVPSPTPCRQLQFSSHSTLIVYCIELAILTSFYSMLIIYVTLSFNSLLYIYIYIYIYI